MKNLNKMQVKYISNENILIVTTTSTPSPICLLSLSLLFVNLFPCYPRILMELKSHTQIFPDNNNNNNNGEKV